MAFLFVIYELIHRSCFVLLKLHNLLLEEFIQKLRSMKLEPLCELSKLLKLDLLLLLISSFT